MSGAWSFPPTCDLSAVLHEMHAKPSPFLSSWGCKPSGASVMSTEFSGPEKLFSQSLSPDCAESRSGLSKPRRHPKPHGRCPHRLPQAPALRLCSSAPFPADSGHISRPNSEACSAQSDCCNWLGTPPHPRLLLSEKVSSSAMCPFSQGSPFCTFVQCQERVASFLLLISVLMTERRQVRHSGVFTSTAFSSPILRGSDSLAYAGTWEFLF